MVATILMASKHYTYMEPWNKMKYSYDSMCKKRIYQNSK